MLTDEQEKENWVRSFKTLLEKHITKARKENIHFPDHVAFAEYMAEAVIEINPDVFTTRPVGRPKKKKEEGEAPVTIRVEAIPA